MVESDGLLNRSTWNNRPLLLGENEHEPCNRVQP